MTVGRHDAIWRCDTEIFFVSLLILYLELALIRWVGTEIRVFAYLGNLILVVCFFGIGLGCYLADRPVPLWKFGLNLMLTVALVANPFNLKHLNLKNISILLCTFEDSPFWGILRGATTVHVASAFIMMGVLLWLIAFVFVPLGQSLASAFQRHPRIVRAYSVNVIGSLVGIWLFDVLSFASLPPVVWFGVLVGLLAASLAASHRRSAAAIGFALLAMAAVWKGQDQNLRTLWTPYYRLTLQPFYAESGKNKVQQGYNIEVNGVFFQWMLNLSTQFLNAHTDIFDSELVAQGHYNLPFSFKPQIERMLIVGAGSGNDAAAALRHGAKAVDCVEIDPGIYALGRELHPEHPYDSPKVRMFVEDARAYFKRAQGPYDVIWFGWLDAHTTGSVYNDMRLDNYVYTRESFSEAKRLLADDGIVILSFASERWWIADRLFAQAREVFGHEPLAYSVSGIDPRYGGDNFTLVFGRRPVTLEMIRDPGLREHIRSHLIALPGTTRPTTDDWPYLYLESTKIPRLHVATLFVLLLIVGLSWGRTFGLKAGANWHFFCLGAAFLLLEVLTVSRATLLFGMTWVVNAIVISAILIMILLSNLTAVRWPELSHRVVVVGLALTLSGVAWVPLDWFNGLAGATKLVAASVFLTAPVFFSGLVFIRSFAACADRARALGSNLIGALVGGLLESVSFVIGIRALVYVVGVFYLVALCLRPRLMEKQ
jgi:spermidine synthase